MKRIVNITVAIIAISVVLPVLTGCEKDLKFNEKDLDRFRGITLNALATKDTVFTLSVSKAKALTEVIPTISPDDYLMYDYLYDSLYIKDALLKDATVGLTVNGDRQYVMTFDPKNNNYKSDYVPVAGDEISLHVEAEDLKPVVAQTVIPTPQKLELLGYELHYDKDDDADGWVDKLGINTVAQITLKITDTGNEKNYYRLVVRGFASFTATYICNDVFRSDDPIFLDENITQGYRGWSARFSNVFDDHLFNGKEYTFTVLSRLRRSNYSTPQRGISIELQSITPELYNYFKSIQLYRITAVDEFSEGVQIYNNVNNGFGIVGGISSQGRIVIEDFAL